METVLDYNIEFLKIHPRNSEFYDDIAGAEYEQFKTSIQNEGVLTPLIVAPDMTVISGHQRLKACRELGIDVVPVIIRQDIRTEEDKMAVLLATNFGRPESAKKKRKIADEYVKLRGNKRGRPEKNSEIRRINLTQEEIAKELGISVSTLNEMLSIERKLTPELKELLDAGVFTESTASKILVKLTPEEQAKLITTFGKDIIEGVTATQMQHYVDKIKQLEEDAQEEINNIKAGYEIKLASMQAKVEDSNLREQIDELIDERNELEAKYRNQYEIAQQYKLKLEETKGDAKKSKDYKDLLAQVTVYQENLDNLNRIIREQEKRLVVFEKMKSISDSLVEEAEQVPLSPVDNLSYERLCEAFVAFNKYTNIYTFEGGIHEKLKSQERARLSALAAEAAENISKIINKIKGTKQ